MSSQAFFVSGDFVVYPAHGVGQVVKVEQEDLGGFSIDLLVIHFDKERLTARVPVAKACAIGLRKLSSPDVMEKALKALTTRRRVVRTMWSRRAQEYEAKIHSGDPISIAEVIRDLHKKTGSLDQAYSERQIYQAALERLGREIAAIERIGEEEALDRLKRLLAA